MHERLRGRAKRVLVVGHLDGNAPISPAAVLASDGMLIVMEADAARAAEMRTRLSREGLGQRSAVIGGDPRRMVYKLAGPFDVIFCSDAYLSARPMLDKLLATDGVFMTNGDT